MARDGPGVLLQRGHREAMTHRTRTVWADVHWYSSPTARALLREHGTAGLVLYDRCLRDSSMAQDRGWLQVDRLRSEVSDLDGWLRFLSNRHLIRRDRRDRRWVYFVKWDEGNKVMACRLMTPTLRASILERDGCCQECGSVDRLEVDHIFPYSLGGSDDPSNLQALCKPCNLQKGVRV